MANSHVARRLLVDLSAPFPVRWCGGDAFRSALLNALSLSFPGGEQYFMDAVRMGVDTLPPGPAREAMAGRARVFVAQEAIHRRAHAVFNERLDKLGLVNRFDARASARREAKRHLPPLAHVASTAATEHFTAVFADWILAHPEALAGSGPLGDFWMWHCAEEAEHRSVAFDLMREMAVPEEIRIKAYKYITFVFMRDLAYQTLLNLWADKALSKASTWRSMWATCFSKDGLIRSNIPHWRAYFDPGFHPSHGASDNADRWLDANKGVYAEMQAAQAGS